MYLVVFSHTKNSLVSIPQAVSTIAIELKNADVLREIVKTVSIPQAVSTIAIVYVAALKQVAQDEFQYRKR